jgi:hypothetical protein
MLFGLVPENKLSLIRQTFTGTSYQLHFTLLFMFTSFRNSVLHLIVFMERACLLKTTHLKVVRSIIAA